MYILYYKRHYICLCVKVFNELKMNVLQSITNCSNNSEYDNNILVCNPRSCNFKCSFIKYRFYYKSLKSIINDLMNEDCNKKRTIM